MSGSYTPDDGATPIDPWRTALLSQRDLGLTVPVNFVTVPGVSLRAACFDDGVYDAAGATRCFSNLLAAGFKRYTLDVYWDVDRSTWSMCPVQIDTSSGDANVVSYAQITSTPVIHLSTIRITAREAEHTPWGAIRNLIGARQDELSSSTTASSSTTVSSSPENDSSTVTLSASLVSSSSASSSASTSSKTTSIPSYLINDTVIDIGDFRCSTNLTLLFFMGTLAEYLGKTMNTLEASLIYLTLDLHAAVPPDDPDGVAPSPSDDDLPHTGQFLSTVLGQNLSSFLYTPSELVNDRSNLNDSWYKLPYQSQPDVPYYETQRESSTVSSTSDGWPGESYIEIQKARRLLVEFGDVDVQMRRYNFSADRASIFPSDFLRSERNTTFSKNGTVTSGCFFEEGQYTVSSTNNNSWAESTVRALDLGTSAQDTSNGTFYSVGNLTACGISPFLNQTLNNASADENVAPYLTIPLSTIWSWSPGEPRNIDDDDDDSNSYHCAVMDMSLRGRWRVADCNEHYNWACRVGSTPYEWEISDQTGSYHGSATTGCGHNRSFSVPKTGLENAALYGAMEKLRSGGRGGNELWVDFNSLDEKHCWVVGANSSCPYTDFGDDQTARTVIIPTVAAIIIFILAVLTLLAKCAANRQDSGRRRRRKGEDGWDYEGVPS